MLRRPDPVRAVLAPLIGTPDAAAARPEGAGDRVRQDAPGQDFGELSPSVRAALAVWLAGRERAVTRHSVANDRLLARGRLPERFLDLPVEAVTRRHVLDVYGYLGADRGLSLGSIQRTRSSLSSFFTWLLDEGVLTVHPVAGTRIPRRFRSPDPVRWLEWDALRALVARGRMVHAPYADLALTLGLTGLRWGEIRALRVEDLQLDASPPALIVRRSWPEAGDLGPPKGGRTRWVPVLDRLAPILRHRAALAGSGLVFFNGAGGPVWRAGFVRQFWGHFGRGLRVHDLRHTFAVAVLQRGIDLATVAAWLGHSQTTTTNRYVRYAGSGVYASEVARVNQGL